MRIELLKWLRCPDCKGVLEAIANDKKGDGIEEGFLICQCKRGYPIRNRVPRFVESEDYTESFGFEWKIHSKTQLDSANQNGISEKMFRSRIDFPLEQLKGQLVLDAGCGMGRYVWRMADHLRLSLYDFRWNPDGQNILYRVDVERKKNRRGS